MGRWVALVPSTGMHLMVPMGRACTPTREAVIGTRRVLHTGLVDCLPWAHVNAMDVCRRHVRAITQPYLNVVRAWLAPPWPYYKSLVTRSDINFRVFFMVRDTLLHSNL